MANEIDVGRIVAEIVLETQQARENAEEISDEFEELNSKKINPTVIPQIDKTTLSYIKGSLEEMGITGHDMINVLNAGFSNLTEAKKYRIALEEIALKIDECRTKMQALNVGDNINSGAVENYSDALTQLEEQYDKVLAKLDDYVAKTVATVQHTQNIENEINELSGLSAPAIFDNGTMLQAQSYEDTITYIRGVLEKLKITGKDADNIISACFDDVSSLKRYQDELEIIAGKLEIERKKYQELLAAKDRAEKRGDYSSIDKITSEMDNQVNKIKTLEARFDSVYKKQDNAIEKTVATYQKQENSAKAAQIRQNKLNEALDNKQAGKNFAGGVNLATTSLRTFNSIAPNAVDGIGEIITQVNSAKQAMTAGATAPVAWGTAIIAGIGIVASLVINEIQKVQQAEEEARQKAAECAESSKQERSELEDLAESYVNIASKLESGNTTYSESIEIKKQLTAIQDQLVEKYGEEARAIDVTNANITENIRLLREQAVERAKDYTIQNYSDYNNAQTELSNRKSYRIEAEYSNSKKIVNIDGEEKTLKKAIIEFMNDYAQKRNQAIEEAIQNGEKNLEPIKIEEYKASLGRIFNLDVAEGQAKDELDRYGKALDDFLTEHGFTLNELTETRKALSDSVTSANANEINQLKEIRSEYEKNQEIIDNNGTDLFKGIEDNAYIQKINEYQSAMSELSSAYQTVATGGKLNEETIRSLCEKYPEIAHHIKDTGDVTLKNGELIKKSYESEQDAAKQATNAEIVRLNKLRESGEATSDQIKNFFKLHDTVSLYNNDIMDLQDTIDIYTNKMNNLSSVYKTVSEGGEIDSKTLESLISQYPELSEYISRTGDLTFEGGKKIKEAYEEERKELIEKLTTKKQELELEKEDSNNKEQIARQISQINAEIEIYKNNQIDNVDWSSIASEVKGLANAYQTLNEGKQLDVDTMINLIDKYPEVASKMAQTGKLGKEQADVFKDLAEAKKNDYIVSQQVALKNLEVSRQETVGIIKNLTAQLQMYLLKGQIMQAMSTLPQIAEQNFNLDKINDEIDKTKARINAIKSIDPITYGKSGNGSGSDRNEALSNELKRLEHKKSLGQLTSRQEYDWLVRINNKYSKNADEQMDMEKRLYNARKQMIADEEAANTKALQAAYKGIENKKSLGKLTSQQELRQLEQIRQRYRMTADERMELEIKIYNLKKSIKDNEISSINTLGDAVTQALKEKYEEQRKAEEERINESVESWKTWEEKTVESIQGQIDALDELADKQESENKRREFENKRQQTALQLAYEKDDYNRTQLQKELNRLDKEEAERLATEQREAKKKALQEQMDKVKEKSSQQQEKLQKQLDKISETYDKMTDTFALKAQAQKFIANNTQNQIVNLIKSYASDYEVAGQTLGDALYNGMKSKTTDIEKWVNGIFGGLTSYQRKVAITANNAADRFWANRNSYQQSITQMSAPKTVQVKQTVNFNQPVTTPVQTRRQLDKTNQALAHQISSGI